MKWVKEHTRITIILAVLAGLIILSIASYVNSGENSFIGRQIQRVTTFVQEPVSDGSNGVARAIKGIFQFKSVMEENDRLRDEVDALEDELIQARLSQAELQELRNLGESLNYSFLEGQYGKVTAKVIAMDGSSWFNIFTINAGAESGIIKDAVVVNGDGLIGRILEVGDGWSKVISIIDENNNVSFQVYRDLSLLGMVSGDGDGGLTGYLFDPEATINEGDILITSGTEIYPAGIPIGQISEVLLDDDSLLKSITIDPSVNFKSISIVTVIYPVT